MERNAHRKLLVRVGAVSGIVCWLAAGGCGSSSSKHDAAALLVEACDGAMASNPDAATAMNDPVVASAAQAIQNGRKTFRFDTFGDEAFWGDTLKLHQAIAGSANGGVGAGLSPKGALAAGAQGRRGRDPGSDSGAADQGGAGRPRQPGHHAGVAADQRRRRRHGILRRRQIDSRRRHPVRALPLDGRRFVQPRASASGSTGGRTAISTSARSSRCRRT